MIFANVFSDKTSEVIKSKSIVGFKAIDVVIKMK